jgi:hypothetical protein
MLNIPPLVGASPRPELDNVHRINQLLDTASLEVRHLTNVIADLRLAFRQLLSERRFEEPEIPRGGWQDSLDQG